MRKARKTGIALALAVLGTGAIAVAGPPTLTAAPKATAKATAAPPKVDPPKMAAPPPSAKADEKKPADPGAAGKADEKKPADPGAQGKADEKKPEDPGKSGEAKDKDKAKGPPAEGPGEALDKLGAKLGKVEDRLEALRVLVGERKKTWEARRAATRERTQLRWGSVAAQPPVREELRHHSRRVAFLQRIRELAQVEGKTAVLERATKALDRENGRHEKRMQQLAAGGAVPAAPGAPGMPAAPAAPGAPGTPAVPAVPAVPGAPGAPAAPATPATPAAPAPGGAR